MVVGGRSVFISYRRQLSETLALLIRNHLVEHRFDTFMDLKNLDGGEFERTILNQIEAREHFIVLLQPGSLGQIGEAGDWLRREIAHALAHRRNVVPIIANGFEFRRDLVLPPDVARLPSFNGVPIQPGYFDAAMERLRTRFLKTPLKPPAAPRPVTRSGQQAQDKPTLARSGKSTSVGEPVLPAPELTGWVHGGREFQLTWSEVPGADEYVLERTSLAASLNLNPTFFEVYRGIDRSFNETPVIGWASVLAGTSAPGWQYRVRASASGQAGRWSYLLTLRLALA